ncbi:sigma-E factor regulatory protein RseB domain-containing protein [Spelaeicoccus albus]
MKWLPVAVVPMVIAGGTLAAHASPDENLPAKTPEQVLTLAQKAQPQPFSGQFTQTSNLGLPSLPQSDQGSHSRLSEALDLATGTHQARVYVGGPRKSRVQVLDKLAERDVVRNGRTVWAYDSAKQAATRVTLPAAQQPSGKHAASPSSPEKSAKKFLANVSPTTRVQLGNDTTVAGRSAYDLVLTPRTSKTLIGSVSIAVDAKTGMALSVAVTARGNETPAVKTAFTSLKLQAPAAGRFNFTPPEGTKVRTKRLKNHSHERATKHDEATTIGHGWTSIVEIPAGNLPGKSPGATNAKASQAASLSALTKKVDGGRLFSSSLVNVLLTNDGRVLAGAVPASALQAAAAQ